MTKLDIKIFNFKSGCNSYLISRQGHNNGLLIEPAFFNKELFNFIQNNNFSPEAVLFTANPNREVINLLKKIYANLKIYYPQNLPNANRQLTLAELNVTFCPLFVDKATTALLINNYLFSPKDINPNSSEINQNYLTALQKQRPKLYLLPSYGPPSLIT